MKQKKLILLTSEFPYGNGETFLETEIEFLAREFDEVIVVSSGRSTEKRRRLPENVRCKLFSTEISTFDKIKALFGVLFKEYKAEKKRVRDVYKLNWSKGIRNTMLISLFTAKRWEKRLNNFVLASSDADLTFYSYWCTDTAIGLSLLQKSHPHIKTFSRAHGWDLYFEATSFQYQPFRELIASSITGLFPISDMGEVYIKRRWKVEPNRIRVARLGTKEVKFCEYKSDRNMLVSCSNLVPLKRVHLIAEALKYVNEIQIDWYHFGDGPEMLKVEGILKGLNSEQIHVYLLGRKENVQILEWFAKNSPDLFVNVSRTEGIPVSIMEAMSFGTPVFATDVGGTSEIVNSANGELLDPTISAEELGKRIELFFSMNVKDKRKLSEKAFETWLTTYNASKNYGEFAKELLS